jgi:hypothetical protein
MDEKSSNSERSDYWVVQKCVYPVITMKVDGDIPIKIRICLFFDGTLNNRTNVDLGEGMRARYPEVNNQTEGSYANDHTNIDKL